MALAAADLPVCVVTLLQLPFLPMSSLSTASSAGRSVRSVRLAWCVAIVAAVCAAYLLVQHTLLQIRVGMAADRVRIFEEMKAAAAQSTDPREICSHLGYVLHYYPSGTTQIQGSQLDHIIETARASSIDTITARLQQITGKDFGRDVERWTKEYPPAR